MKVLANHKTALLLTTSLILGMAGLMVIPSAVAKKDAPEYSHDINRLKGLKSFEIYHFHDPFNVEANKVPPELVSFTDTALRHTPALPKASPAEGVIVLQCVKPDCGVVRATVRAGGVDSPIVWHVDADNYWFYTGDEFYSEPKNPRKVAKELMKKLAHDYSSI